MGNNQHGPSRSVRRGHSVPVDSVRDIVRTFPAESEHQDVRTAESVPDHMSRTSVVSSHSIGSSQGYSEEGVSLQIYDDWSDSDDDDGENFPESQPVREELLEPEGLTEAFNAWFTTSRGSVALGNNGTPESPRPRAKSQPPPVVRTLRFAEDVDIRESPKSERVQIHASRRPRTEGHAYLSGKENVKNAFLKSHDCKPIRGMHDDWSVKRSLPLTPTEDRKSPDGAIFMEDDLNTTPTEQEDFAATAVSDDAERSQTSTLTKDPRRSILREVHYSNIPDGDVISPEAHLDDAVTLGNDSPKGKASQRSNSTQNSANSTCSSHKIHVFDRFPLSSANMSNQASSVKSSSKVIISTGFDDPGSYRSYVFDDTRSSRASTLKTRMSLDVADSSPLVQNMRFVTNPDGSVFWEPEPDYDFGETDVDLDLDLVSDDQSSVVMPLDWQTEISWPFNKEQSGDSQSRVPQVTLKDEFDPKNFLDKVKDTDMTGKPIPAWKRLLIARQLAEKAQIDTAEQRKKEEEEARYGNMPPWKKALLQKRLNEVKT